MTDWLHLVTDKLLRWYVHLVKMLPNIVLAIIVLSIAIYAAKFIRKLANRLIIRFSGHEEGTNLLATIIYLAVIFVGLFVALDILQLGKAVSSLLAGAGILGLAVGFAFQDLTANFISGVYITFKKPFQVGHTVETNGSIGNIEDIQLRTTTIRTFSGLHLMIPNKDIFQKSLINYSLTPARRIELELLIPIENDLEKVVEVSKEAIHKMGYLFEEKPVEVYFTEITQGIAKVSVWFWISNHLPPGYMVARHDALISLAKIYKENNIIKVNVA
jgi:small conductance mechanosensitive channel